MCVNNNDASSWAEREICSFNLYAFDTFDFIYIFADSVFRKIKSLSQEQTKSLFIALVQNECETFSLVCRTFAHRKPIKSRDSISKNDFNTFRCVHDACTLRFLIVFFI